MKNDYVKIVRLEPTSCRWLIYSAGILFILLGFISIMFIGGPIMNNIGLMTYSLVCFIIGYFDRKAVWYLKTPNQKTFDLYKIDNEYVAVSSYEEALLWAESNSKDGIPEKISTVHQFQ